MFRVITALALTSAAPLVMAASAPAPSSPSIAALNSSSPWWERVTVTISGDGKPRSCQFSSSLKPDSAQACEVQASEAAMEKTATGSKDSYTRITFERRFSPDWQSANAEAPAGDTLLGQQVMSLAIGSRGTVDGCQIVSASGDMKPEYGCKEASAERFQASAPAASQARRQGYMTILVYGHSEHVV